MKSPLFKIQLLNKYDKDEGPVQKAVFTCAESNTYWVDPNEL